MGCFWSVSPWLSRVTVCLVAIVAQLIPIWVGVYLFPPAAAGLRGLAGRSRALAARWSGISVREPEPWVVRSNSQLGRLLRCWDILGDRGFWREVRWGIVDPLSGAVLAFVPFALLDPHVISQLLNRHTARGTVAVLTDREREVLTLMAEGRSNAAIGQRLRIGDSAVTKHTNNIFTKLDLLPSNDDNRRVLAVLAFLNR